MIRRRTAREGQRARGCARRRGRAAAPQRAPASLVWLDSRLSLLALVVVAVALSACGGGLPTAVTVDGHGWGHGRGMGQWGAFGYAVDHGWTDTQILDHFYGGTTSQPLGTNPAQRVLLRSRQGLDLVAYQERGLLTTDADGFVGRYRAMKVHRLDATRFELSTGDSCTGGWTPWKVVTASEVHLRPLVNDDDRANMLQLCSAAGARTYRARLVAVQGRTTIETVNMVDTESYLRSVVAREVSPSWADAGGGRGAAAVRAQAVAARSYAIAGDSRWGPWATTCDDTACQVYAGVAYRPTGGALTVYEDARTDRAVAATGQVVRRRPDGRVPATEFSSSSGGWTVGATFPAVVDDGDDTAANSNHDWTVTLAADAVEAAFDVRQGGDVGDLEGIDVTARNGLGQDGGRVTQVTVRFTGSDVVLTGEQLASTLRLKSNWFVVR